MSVLNHALTLSPFQTTLSAFKNPPSHDMYYDSVTGGFAKKKIIKTKMAVPKKDNSIMLELNIASDTSDKHS